MLPELAKSCHPVFGRGPNDDHAVDRANRDAGGPVRLIIAFGQRLVDPGLIRAKRATSLQRDLLVDLTLASWFGILDAVATLAPLSGNSRRLTLVWRRGRASHKPRPAPDRRRC